MKTKILSLLFVVCQIANAQLVQKFTGGDSLFIGPGTGGFNFTVGNISLSVSALGVWSDTTLFSSHLVGVWDMTPQHNLLASVLVTPQTAIDINDFWYTNLSAPLTLNAGQTYMIGARYSDNDFDSVKGNIVTITTDPNITIQDAHLSTGVGFEFPDLNVSGANLGFIGPNASFVPVPEPALLTLITGFVLVAFIGFRRYLG